MNPIKPLLLSASDLGGGAAIAAYRLHQGLTQLGIESQMLVQEKLSDDHRVVTSQTKLGKGWAKIAPSIDRLLLQRYPHRDRTTYSLQWLPNNLVERVINLKPNILNLHWVCESFLRIEDLARLQQVLQVPIVWTLHDMWPFTGGCHYSFDCDRYQQKCGTCPQLHSNKENDLSHWIWQRKIRTWPNLNMAIVAPSKWLAEQARQSMFMHLPIHHIPYGIDTNAYRPIDQSQCRSVLGVPEHKKILLFGAHSLSEPRKGGDLLIAALQAIPASLKQDLCLLTLGDGGAEIAQAVGIANLSLGYASGDRLKAVVYNAADLVLVPTRADNLPLVLQESLACGTPMVSFRVGGVSDLVRPGITGALAAPNNALDFRDRIMELLDNPDQLAQMATNCRQIALKEYPLHQQTQQYINLFRSLQVNNRSEKI
ncbi:glycosyl transferase group 1 [Thalassoporum mexicanum PCC 7367]|uniref:glycosyltransferase family 4 protein n=1 Tax=Thalassoporum mexicanum TaxID=3457544 RepID=UPI00029F8CEC|nr:glycosyltransferase family 4 protein [Pseudanabaena sp. PCC 7367]AFY71866.1 glycosyl transferase group 1 [Pseudanabaena sp. PCC 7367]